jgi:hypothetical protein
MPKISTKPISVVAFTNNKMFSFLTIIARLEAGSENCDAMADVNTNKHIICMYGKPERMF